MAGTASRVVKTAPSALPKAAATATRAPASEPQPTAGDKIRRVRFWQRTVVRTPAELLRAGGRSPTLIRGLSRHGASLVGADDLVRGEAVALELACGRILFGRVRWRVGMRAGIALDVTLAADDPLLGATPPAASRCKVETVAAEPGSGRWQDRDHRMLARACREQGFAWLV